MRRSPLKLMIKNHPCCALFKPVLVGFSLLPFYGSAQWSTGGNTGAAGQWLGTNNNFPLSIKTNNTERLNIAGNGTIKFNGLNGTGSGLLLLSNDGAASRLSFPGTTTQVLNGAGSFVNISSLSGWNTSGGATTTTNKIGIGVTNPVNPLEVQGNGIFSGTVYAQGFTVMDVASVQGSISFNSNMYISGYDPSAFTRNEVYTSAQDYFVQSSSFYNRNTIINSDNTGKVGIGLNSPIAKFHVYGNSKFEGEVKLDSLTFGSSLTMKVKTISGKPSVVFTPPAGSFIPYTIPSCISMGTAGMSHGVNGLYHSYNTAGILGGSLTMGHNGSRALIQSYGADSTGTLSLNYYCGNDVEICTGNQGGNVIMTSDAFGKVGVGTNQPKTKFQVKTGIFSVHMGSALSEALAYGTSYLGFNAARVTDSSWSTGSDAVHNGGALMYSNVMGDLFFASIPHTGASGQTGISDATVLGNTRLYIASTGQTGIGTRCIPGGYKLAVDGRIICEGVKVKNNDSTGCWPDYVFDPQYRPLTIDELENFVKRNKHLPGMPSEKEVMQEGVDLVELNKALLKATEEHSLYIIALKKENEQMKQEMKELKEMMQNKK